MQGEKLGRYEVTGTLGRGAMGVVYDARDPGIGRRVAIKTLPLHDRNEADTADELARFQREAQAAGRLHHPNVVGVYDYGETPDLAYIVMEFVDGTSLKSVFDAGERYPTAEAVRLMHGLLAGMQYCHERGVVHRDIKPGNVMLARDGTVKITDFGIARIESSVLTQAGTVMGTPAYMSPEQVNGETVDARSDIYSAGVLLYQLLTGEKPFDGSMATIMHKVLNTVPPPPSALSVNAPARLDAVVATAMAKRPDQRFQTAADFSAALARAYAAPADADGTMVASAAPVAETPTVVLRREPPPVPPAPSKPGGGRGPLLGGIAAVVLVAVGAGAFFALRGPTTPAPQPKPVPENVAPTPKPEVAAPTPPAPPPAKPHTIEPPQQAPAAAPPETMPQAPPVVEPPPPAAPPKPDPAAVREAVTRALAPIKCAMLRGDVDADGKVVVEGVAGPDRVAEVGRALDTAAPAAPRDVRVAALQGTRYCGVLDLLRPFGAGFGAAATGAPALSLKDGEAVLRTDDYLVPRVTMPGFAGYLTLDDFISDGSLGHLAFRQADKPLRPRQTLTVGDPQPDNVADNLPALFEGGGWQVSPPYGTDLLVAIASEKPLFDKPRGDETPAAYERALAAAIEGAQRRKLRIGAAAMGVPTAAR